VFGVVLSGAVPNCDMMGTGGPGCANPQALTAGLDAAANDNGHVEWTELGTYRSLVNFTEIRFECKKVSVPRKLHIKSASDSVLDFFSGASAVPPSTSGTVIAMADDTSILGANGGSGWGSSGNGTWGHTNHNGGAFVGQQLWWHAMFIEAQTHWLVGWDTVAEDRWECDDGPGVAGDGYWYIWVK
jgi:hypothetical protein